MAGSAIDDEGFRGHPKRGKSDLGEGNLGGERKTLHNRSLVSMPSISQGRNRQPADQHKAIGV
jgi:hypothetical protein